MRPGRLDRLAADLDEGAVIVVEEARVRVRRLPIIPDELLPSLENPASVPRAPPDALCYLVSRSTA
jgi:hypothetical protein